MRQLSCRPCGHNGGDELVAGQILIATEVHYNIRNPEGGEGIMRQRRRRGRR
jgi:NAD(P)H-hydrate repair Nnr-like enzyme with NAD(P)H-hydrate epimerase domain